MFAIEASDWIKLRQNRIGIRQAASIKVMRLSVQKNCLIPVMSHYTDDVRFPILLKYSTDSRSVRESKGVRRFSESRPGLTLSRAY